VQIGDFLYSQDEDWLPGADFFRKNIIQAQLVIVFYCEKMIKGRNFAFLETGNYRLDADDVKTIDTKIIDA